MESIELARKGRGRRKFRRGHAPYLARIRLYWCDHCNVPLVDETQCAVCGSKSRKVELSPPGDPFPAMYGHISKAVDAIDSQFGQGIGQHILPHDKTIVFNKVSSLDVMFEVVVDGHIIGKLRYDIKSLNYKFILSLEGGRRLSQVSKRKWVSCHNEVLPYLKKGVNLMVPGIAGCDSDIQVNDEVWLIDSSGTVFGVGIARMSGSEMAREEKGYAVKIREVDAPRPPSINPRLASWDDAVKANINHLQKIEDESIGFIKRLINRYNLPVVVGFSGGKDSLVVYLLVEKATEESPKIFFMNTGIEFPETVQHVYEFAEKHDAEIIGYDAGDQFWDSLQEFGPPARDFRWCCKVLKLGPASASIAEILGGEVLTFMGQRKLESFQRSIEPRVTRNPWVQGQLSANPIQNWNALEVWLYIFKEGEAYNPLYNSGYTRMGCYLCPSSPLAEIERIQNTHPELYNRWINTLSEWARSHEFPQEWIDYGFWRWKHLPGGQQNLAAQLGLEIRPVRQGVEGQLQLSIAKGVSPCKAAAYSLEGQFSMGLDLTRIADIMHIFGKSKVSEELGAIRVKGNGYSIILFSSGSLVIRGEDPSRIEKIAGQIEHAVRRSLFCQGCGSCIPKCSQNALSLDNNKIAVDSELCTRCLKCDRWPCPTYLE